MKSLLIMGTVITDKTARGFMKRIATKLGDNLTMESSIVLSDIESQLVAHGFFTWSEIEEIEIEAIA